VTACARCGTAVESDSATYCPQCRARVHDERQEPDPPEFAGYVPPAGEVRYDCPCGVCGACVPVVEYENFEKRCSSCALPREDHERVFGDE